MKILFVFNHPAPYKVALLNGLSAHHDLHVIFERGKAKDRQKEFYNEQKYQFTLHKIKGLSLGNENHLSFGVKKHIKHNKYDLIIINGYSTLTEMIALRYLKRKKNPYAFYINGGIVKAENKLAYRIKKYFISGASLYFSPAYKANEYLTHYGAPAHFINNYPYSTVYQKDIVNTKLSGAEKAKFWEEKGIKSDNFTICVTSFIKRKNNEAIIKAWRDVPPTNSLIFVGEGPLHKEYEELIEKYNLKNVFLLPYASKEIVFNYLKHADNAVYLSNYDIYGHVINEALAHGLNILTSPNMVAACEVIKDDINGLFVSDNIADSLNKLFRKDYFNAAIKSAISVEESIKKHLEILERIK